MKNAKTNSIDTNGSNVWEANPWNLPYDLDHVNKVRSIPLTDEIFWEAPEKETPRAIRIAKDLGSTAVKAAGITSNIIQLAPLYALAASSKAGEKLWQGADTAAVHLEDIASSVVTEAGEVTESIRQGAGRVATNIEEAAIGERLRGFAITAANTSGTVAPLAPVRLWEATSGSREKLRSGASKVTARLGEMAIGETIKNAIDLDPVRRKSAEKSTSHRKNYESSLKFANKRVGNIEDILTRDRPNTEEQINQSRQLAEKYKRLSSRALASGHYGNYKKYLKKAEQQQLIYSKSRR